MFLTITTPKRIKVYGTTISVVGAMSHIVAEIIDKAFNNT